MLKHCFLPLLAGIFILLAVSSCKNRITVTTDGVPQSTAITLAADDLQELLGEALKVSGHASPYTFAFQIDTTLRDGSFSYRETEPGYFLLRGGDPMTLSHAVYSLLEELGYTFDITGVTVPAAFNFAALDKIDRTVMPSVRWRGIRQHVNFPMDISSYPIGEAKEYLKNLVRMRFNKLAIHSYPGQWYDTEVADTINYAGHFFYGDRHYMYDSPLLQRVVRFNDSTFCMPAAEACYDNPPERSAVAIGWMQELMACAKELGLQIQFSFEPRMATPAEAAKLGHKIIETYPQIDALELMTEETGGWAPKCTKAEIEGTLRQYFPASVLQDTMITNPIRPQQTDLNQLYAEIGINTQAIQLLRADTSFTNKIPAESLKMGIYCTMPEYYAAGYRLARTMLPDAFITMLPSHGSDGVARAFDRIITNRDDLSKTEIYSWIEFDGLMYVQQNGVQGIAGLEDKMAALNGGKQCQSLLFNHWRTAENRTPARFAAISTLTGNTDPDAFYRGYAGRLGISDGEQFAAAMDQLNKVDSYATHALGNVGFCWMGAWDGQHSPYTYVKMENVGKAIEGYMQAGEMFAGLYQSTASVAGKEMLSLLGNRTSASVVYLKAFAEVGRLDSLQGRPDNRLSAEEQQRVVGICDHALLVFDQYMETFAAQMPDRGAEGTLVSVWNGPIRGVKVLRSRLGGLPMEALPQSNVPVDAPPLPIFYETK